MSISVQFIRKIDKLDPDLKEVFLSFLEEIQNTVTKVEFNELKQVVQDLAVKVGELTSVQKELACAQKRTEVRMEEFTQAQKELACAQKNTEIAIQKLTKEQGDMKQHMSGLGFYLENQAYKYLPELLKKDLNIEMKEKLIRKHIKGNDGNYIEVNITGKGIRDTEEIIIIGECKHRLSENKINEFINKNLKKLEGIFKEIIVPVMVTHMTSSPDVEDYAQNKGIKIYYSYELQ